MKRVCILMLLLASCDSPGAIGMADGTRDFSASVAAGAERAHEDINGYAANASAESADPEGGGPDRSPRDVARLFYARLARRDYAGARALTDAGGRAARASAEAFARDAARFTDYHVTLGEPGRVDAGAGQRWVSVPVRAAAIDRASGKRRRWQGQLDLHRSVMEGGTPDWRIARIELHPTA